MPRAARVVIPLAAVLGVIGLAASFMRVDTRKFRIPSESMLATLAIGDRITVNEDAYDDEDPRRHDVVVIRPPQGATGDVVQQCGTPPPPRTLCAKPTRDTADVFFVERIVGLPGERLRVREGRAIVNGRPLDEPYAQECLGGDTCTFRGEITIPPDHYFVMGDNRGASDDSRFWGPVPRDQIVGRADDCWPLGLKCSKTDDPG